MHGSPTDPLTEEELFSKFKFNAALSLPRSAVERAFKMWWNMDTMANVSEGLETVAGESKATE